MASYRFKPVEVDAVQWTGDNWGDIVAVFGNPADVAQDVSSHALLVSTPEGRRSCMSGDWLVRDASAAYYPWRDAEFHSVFEPLED